MISLTQFQRVLNTKNAWRLAVFTLPALAAVSYFAVGVTPPTSSTFATVSLAPEPLYAKGTRDKPTLTLALSVEFPTVGAQYVSTPGATTDASYTQATEYLGYFDVNSCYTYIDNPATVAGYSTADLKRFERTGAATNHGCGGAGFSGNFMNWATSSAIDVLRLGLTGGDRIVDTTDLTVVQRAVLRNGGFYNDSNFPAKQLLASLANDALPSTLRYNHTGDIWVSNCLNRVHFGTQSTGSCGAPGNNSNLGASSAGAGGITPFTGTLTGFSGTSCANENGTCTFTGTKGVAYGAGTAWNIGVFTGSTPCTNGVFGDPLSGTAKKCYVATTWTPPSSTTTLLGATAITSDNFFYTRVRVCESAAGVTTDTRKYNNEDYCLKYASGYFKPAGNLQKYSDRLRVAAFGYLMDDTLDRYGGVLRAPMKYVGPKTYDINGSLVSGTNSKIEWNETTGVFTPNPESASEGKSGVINYLNQFGRTGTTQGTYKTYDPVGELYYEALRYVQGLDPTPNATSGITTAMKDGFPVYDMGTSGITSAWTDPHAGSSSTKDYSCLRNNIVVVGDVNTHADKSVPGNTLTTSNDFTRTASIANNEPDFRAWTNVVGGFEKKTSVSYVDGAGVTRNTNATNTNTANPSSNYPNLQDAAPGCCNNNSYLMAGVAYWANTHDVRGTDWTAQPSKQRPGMRVTTYALDVNEYGNQTNLTTRRNNQFYLAAKYGGFKDISGGKGNPFLNSGGATDNSGWETSTGSNLASKYFLSSSAADVLKSLRDIFENIAQEGNSIAGGAISTQRLTSVGGYIYQAQFDAADWSGDLISYPVSVSSTNVVTIADGTTVPAQWAAGAKLNAKIAADPTASTRKIFAGKKTPSTTSYAIEFKTLSDFELSVQGDLDKATPAGAADGNAQLRINYLRGDRSLEGTSFRKRGGLLGDIINSGVAFSGAPSTRIFGSGYSTFATANQSRKKILFVGANDGMLHAFNSADGEEVFAYIPSWLVSKLPALTNATYNTGNHQSFMDGSPVVAEAKVGGVSEADPAAVWKTVLVSGTGGGGQGVFGLDVTDPDAFDATKVLWEFTDKDDADMGNVVGRPQILKFRISGSGSTAVYKWFAVVASGVNNHVNDGYFSLTGRPALFLLDIGKATNAAWTLGTNYYKISLPMNTTIAATNAPGLINFKVVGGPVDEVALIYAGDLHGNLWKLKFDKGTGFDFADWNSATYNEDLAVNKLSPFQATGSTPFQATGSSTPTAIPFFTAKDGVATTSKVQPITMEPALVRGPGGGVIVSFGTGKYMESTDNVVNSSTQVQSIYALLDNNSSSADSSNPAAIIKDRDRLKGGSINSSTGAISVPTFVWGRATSTSDTTQRSGWFVNFVNSGERQISGFGVFANQVVFGSVIPPDAVVDACGSGTGYQYAVNIATGVGQRDVSQVGLLGEPFVLEVGGSNVTKRDSTGRRIKTTTGQIILQGSTGLKAVSSQPTDQSIVGRLSWRQINNYQDLKNAP